MPSAVLNRPESGGARGWRVRLTDYEFRTSPEARELVRHEQIVVIDYRGCPTGMVRDERAAVARGNPLTGYPTRMEH